jgi:hypothetical protein
MMRSAFVFPPGSEAIPYNDLVSPGREAMALLTLGYYCKGLDLPTDDASMKMFTLVKKAIKYVLL